jgi:hypothetical protein
VEIRIFFVGQRYALGVVQTVVQFFFHRASYSGLFKRCDNPVIPDGLQSPYVVTDTTL